MDRKNVYKIVDNVDNSENRRKYRKIAVNKNVRNYLAKRQIVWIRSKKRPCGKKENSIFHREQVKRKKLTRQMSEEGLIEVVGRGTEKKYKFKQ